LASDPLAAPAAITKVTARAATAKNFESFRNIINTPYFKIISGANQISGSQPPE
jgi:hypothetical protein